MVETAVTSHNTVLEQAEGIVLIVKRRRRPDLTVPNINCCLGTAEQRSL